VNAEYWNPTCYTCGSGSFNFDANLLGYLFIGLVLLFTASGILGALADRSKAKHQRKVHLQYQVSLYAKRRRVLEGILAKPWCSEDHSHAQCRADRERYQKELDAMPTYP
jgi:hypothetical protein